MKTKRKRIAALFMTVVLAVGMPGCKKTENPSETIKDEV